MSYIFLNDHLILCYMKLFKVWQVVSTIRNKNCTKVWYISTLRLPRCFRLPPQPFSLIKKSFYIASTLKTTAPSLKWLRVFLFLTHMPPANGLGIYTNKSCVHVYSVLTLCLLITCYYRQNVLSDYGNFIILLLV